MDAQLAKEYNKGMAGSTKDASPYRTPPLNWIMSEKYDGYRALFRYRDGVPEFMSRAGKPYHAPPWFLEAMPPPQLLGDAILDGELWAGRDRFQDMGVVRKKVPLDEDWRKIQYLVYDLTNVQGTFHQRLQRIRKICSFTDIRWKILAARVEPYETLEPPLVYADQQVVTSVEQMDAYYQSVVSIGGEGIMLKHPTNPYEKGRSPSLLKYKPVYDRDAILIGHKLGKGKYEGLLGAFICKPLINHGTYSSVDEDPNHVFTLSGMDDGIRTNYLESHPIGTIISYEFSGYTTKGVPRFGRYLRVRTDLTLKQESSDSTEGIQKVLAIFQGLESHYREQNDTFRLKSYVRAIHCVQTLTHDSQMTDGSLSSMEGIGSATTEKIRVILETGSCPAYDKIQATRETSDAKALFIGIHGVGPVHASKLVKAGFRTLHDLRSCDTLSEHMNEVQLLGLTYYDDMQERIPYNEIRCHEDVMKDALYRCDPAGELTIAGSYRRGKPDSGDIDVLIKGTTKGTYETFIQTLISEGYLICTLAHGPKKYMGMGKLLHGVGRRIDIMYTTPEEYPFAIFYFTGSMEFNQRIRKDILDRGMTINEYSLKDNETKEKVSHTFRTEQDIFDYLGYAYVEPGHRIR